MKARKRPCMRFVSLVGMLAAIAIGLSALSMPVFAETSQDSVDEPIAEPPVEETAEDTQPPGEEVWEEPAEEPGSEEVPEVPQDGGQSTGNTAETAPPATQPEETLPLEPAVPQLRYDPQPETEQDILDILLEGRYPRWQYPVGEELIPGGYILEEGDLAGQAFYTLAEYQREAETMEIATAAALREALAGAVDGDVLVLRNSIDLGYLAAGDGVGDTLQVPSDSTITIQSGDNGTCTLYRLDDNRHFSLQGVQNTTLVFEDVLLYAPNDAGIGGGIELIDCENITLRGLQLGGNQAENGGALIVYNSTLALENASFADNSANGRGGAVALYNSTAHIIGSRFENNMALSGGAIYTENSALELDATSLTGNKAVAGGEDCARGGAILAAGASLLQSGEGVVLQGNTAQSAGTAAGGGIYLANTASMQVHGSIQLEKNIVRSDNATAMGGGIAVGSDASLQTTGGVTLTGNRARSGKNQSFGGALYFAGGNTGSALLGDMQAVQNSANAGGALYLNEGAQLVVAAEDGTAANIATNTAGAGGGAVCVNEGASLELRGAVTITDNAAPNGGAIYTYTLDAVTVEQDVVFDGNHASLAYRMRDASDIATHNQKVKAQSYTQPFVYLYNNCDVNYQNGEPVYGWGEQEQDAGDGQDYELPAPYDGPTYADTEAIAYDRIQGETQEYTFAEEDIAVDWLDTTFTPIPAKAEDGIRATVSPIALLLVLLSGLVSVVLLLGLVPTRRSLRGQEGGALFHAMWREDKAGCLLGLGGMALGIVNAVLFFAGGHAAQSFGGLLPAMALVLLLQLTVAALLRCNGETDGPGHLWSNWS